MDYYPFRRQQAIVLGVMPNLCVARDVLLWKYAAVTRRYAELVAGFCSRSYPIDDTAHFVVHEAFVECVAAKAAYAAHLAEHDCTMNSTVTIPTLLPLEFSEALPNRRRQTLENTLRRRTVIGPCGGIGRKQIF